jgi:hypothetical protein
MFEILCLLFTLPLLGAVTAGQIVRKQGPCKRRSVPVAASTVLYEGTMCFEDAGGDFTGTVLENGAFGGIVCETVDNSAGADEAKDCDVWTTGDFVLPMDTTSLTHADIGKPVYGVDNYTVTETATDLVPVGILVKILSTSLAIVSIHGIGERDTGPLVT